MTIAIIPARAGSKRIKDKNIKDFCGKPIISYAINSAIQSSIFDRIIVSTNSAQIRDIALNFGAEVPHLRDEVLSDDFTSTLDVICHEAKKLNLEDDDIICCIYPTSPFLKVEFLKEGLRGLNKYNYCFSACNFNSNPLKSFFLKDNKLYLLNKEYEFSRSQDLEQFYYDAGQFYFGYAKNFFHKKPIFSEDSSFVILPQKYVCDINTQDDWEIAEMKYKIICM